MAWSAWAAGVSQRRRPLFGVYGHIVDGRIVKRTSDGRIGVVVGPRHHPLSRTGSLLPAPVRMVRWQGSSRAVPVPDKDVQAWLTDRFANEAWVPEPIRIAQLNGWNAPTGKKEMQALQQALKQQRSRRRQGAARIARSVSTHLIDLGYGTPASPPSAATPIQRLGGLLAAWWGSGDAPDTAIQTPQAELHTPPAPPPASPSLHQQLGRMARSTLKAVSERGAQLLGSATPMALFAQHGATVAAVDGMPGIDAAGGARGVGAADGQAKGADGGPGGANVLVAFDEAVLRRMLAVDRP